MAKFSELDFIIRYESGELNDKETLKLFSHLIKTDKVWHLQGHYGRTAQALIDDGFIATNGKLTEKAREFMNNN